MLLSILLPWFGPRQLSANSQEAATLAQQVIELTNAERAAYGLPPLKLQANLQSAAMWIAQDNADHNQLSHTDSLGRTIEQRFPAFGYSGYSIIGENLHAGLPGIRESRSSR